MTYVYKYICCVVLVYIIYTHDRHFESMTSLLTEPVNKALHNLLLFPSHVTLVHSIFVVFHIPVQ